MTVRSGSPFEARYGFARARRVGERLEVAGTAPIPVDGGTPAGTPGEQFRRCAEIVVAALGQLAPSWRVVRTRMYITDPADADEIGRAHADAFGADEPVATMVVVAALLDPAWKVELEVEAIVDRRS